MEGGISRWQGRIKGTFESLKSGTPEKDALHYRALGWGKATYPHKVVDLHYRPAFATRSCLVLGKRAKKYLYLSILSIDRLLHEWYTVKRDITPCALCVT
jgi:hypothetical protein